MSLIRQDKQPNSFSGPFRVDKPTRGLHLSISTIIIWLQKSFSVSKSSGVSSFNMLSFRLVVVLRDQIDGLDIRRVLFCCE
jgi:hypothetical protein